MRFETVKLTALSKPDAGWYASEDDGVLREVDCEISHRLARGTKHFL